MKVIVPIFCILWLSFVAIINKIKIDTLTTQNDSLKQVSHLHDSLNADTISDLREKVAYLESLPQAKQDYSDKMYIEDLEMNIEDMRETILKLSTK